MSERDQKFRHWIATLTTGVIEGEFGYEEGEFSVYPDLWRPLFDEGLTPAQAWQRALDAFAEERRREEQARKDDWERIQREDAAILPSTGEGAG